jgi:hypothetical protein
MFSFTGPQFAPGVNNMSASGFPSPYAGFVTDPARVLFELQQVKL